MIEFIQALKDLGSTSLSAFWFPLALWTVLGLAATGIMKYSGKIHAVYQYHGRVALLFALPLSLLAPFLGNKLLSSFTPDQTFSTAFIVVQSPVTISAAGAEQAGWADPALWLGVAMAILLLTAAGCLVKMIFDFMALRRFSYSLQKKPLTASPSVSAANRRLAESNMPAPSIAFTGGVQVPFTFGWIGAIIVFPESMKDDDRKFNMALRHELMHIKHRDYLLNNLIMTIKAVFWFHPLVHYLHKSFKEYREISCDSEVLADAAISKKGYAALLLELAPGNVFPNSRAVSMAVNPSTLKKRIQVMKDQAYSKKTSRSSLVLAFVSALLITGIIACSDLQNTGITNQDVAEVQRNIVTTPDGKHPLYIINGERMDLKKSGDIISRIKPKYIKSVDILKGQKATDEYGSAGKNGVVEITLLNKEKAFSDLRTTPVKRPTQEYFVVVEEMPKLIGGLASIQKNITYPEMARRAGIEGRVIVRFIVNEQGEVENPEIMRGIGAGCDEAAMEAVRQAKFEPGKQRGKAVPVQYSLPIVFRLPGNDTIQKQSSTTSVEHPKVNVKKFEISNIATDESGVVSGMLTDAGTGEPLPGANIVIEGTSTGTSTASDGRFQLRNVPPGDQTLVVSYIGYKSAALQVTVK